LVSEVSKKNRFLLEGKSEKKEKKGVAKRKDESCGR